MKTEKGNPVSVPNLSERTIWVVEGSSGEYSDHQEWPLKAFADEKAAQRLVVEAQARANEIQGLMEADWDAWYDLTLIEPRDPRTLNEFDPDLSAEEALGVHYTCYPIQLVESGNEKGKRDA